MRKIISVTLFNFLCISFLSTQTVSGASAQITTQETGTHIQKTVQNSFAAHCDPCPCRGGYVKIEVYWFGEAGSSLAIHPETLEEIVRENSVDIDVFKDTARNDLIVSYPGVSSGQLLSVDGTGLPGGTLGIKTYFRVTNSNGDTCVSEIFTRCPSESWPGALEDQKVLGKTFKGITVYSITDENNNYQCTLDKVSQDWRVGGNVVGPSNSTIGTLNDQDVQIITNNKARAIITKNGNVGIGTTRPVVKLEVDGKVGIGASDPKVALNVRGKNTDDAMLKVESESGSKLFTVSPQGYVGIRELIPYVALNVRSDNSDSLALNMYNHNGNSLFQVDPFGNTGVRKYKPDVAFNVRANNSNRYLFNLENQSGTSLFQVDSVGNVGVGRSTPAAALFVRAKKSNSSALMVANETGPNVFQVGLNGSVGIREYKENIVLNVRGNGVNANILNIEDQTGNGLFMVHNHGLVGVRMFKPYVAFNVKAGSSDRYLFHLESQTGTSLFEVDTVGNVEINGRIGIGVTNTSGHKLDVDGQTRIRTINNNNSLDKILVEDAAGVIHYRDLSTMADADADPTNEFNSNATLSGTTLQITDGGGTKSVDLSSLARPDSDWTLSGTDQYSAVTGNVGIGTTIPGVKLQVNGNVGIRSADPKVALNVKASFFDDNILNLESSGGSDLFKVDKYGNTGIRQKYSTVALNVRANASDTWALFTENKDEQGLLMVRNDGNVGVRALGDNSALTIKTASSNQVALALINENNNNLFLVDKNGNTE